MRNHLSPCDDMMPIRSRLNLFGRYCTLFLYPFIQAPAMRSCWKSWSRTSLWRSGLPAAGISYALFGLALSFLSHQALCLCCSEHRNAFMRCRQWTFTWVKKYILGYCVEIEVFKTNYGLTAFTWRYYPQRLKTIQALTAKSTIQGDSQLIRSS